VNANAQKWVDALRSGEFEQAKGALYKNGGYCCLGVACEVALRDGLDLEVEEFSLPTENGLSNHKTYAGSESLLPAEVMRWLGLRPSVPPNIPLPTPARELQSLVYLNDKGWSLEEIADLIERYSESIFED
jgi:hypothetical protein